MEKLFICNLSYSLACFLSMAKGYNCPHAHPHIHNRECYNEVCTRLPDLFLRGCSCKQVEEESL